jgi:hypothetical protein
MVCMHVTSVLFVMVCVMTFLVAQTLGINELEKLWKEVGMA